MILGWGGLWVPFIWYRKIFNTTNRKILDTAYAQKHDKSAIGVCVYVDWFEERIVYVLNRHKVWKGFVNNLKIKIKAFWMRPHSITTQLQLAWMLNTFLFVSRSHVIFAKHNIFIEFCVSNKKIIYICCIGIGSKYQAHRLSSALNPSNRLVILAPGSQSIKMNMINHINRRNTAKISYEFESWAHFEYRKMQFRFENEN